MTQVQQTEEVQVGVRERSAYWSLGVALEALLALVLGLYHLGTKSFWLDESFTANLVRGSWHDLGDSLRHVDPNMSAYDVFLKVWSTFGTSEAWLRLPSVFAFVGCVVAVALLGRRLVSPRVGLIAGLLCATTPFLVRYAQEARSYSMVACAATVATLAFVCAIEERRTWQWVVYVLAVVIAVHLHFFGGFVLVANVVALAGRSRSTVPWRQVMVACGVVAVVCAPLLVLVATGPSAQLDWLVFSVGHSVSTLRPVLGTTVPLVLLVAGVFAVTCCFSVVQFVRGTAQRWPAAVLVAWAIVPMVIAVAYSVAVRPLFLGRYLIVCVPAIVISVAWMVSLLPWRRAVIAVVALVVLLSALSIHRWYEAAPLEDWRSAVADVLQRAEPGDGLVFCAPSARFGFLYYATDDDRAHRLRPLGQDPAGVFGARIDDASEYPARVWLVSPRADSAVCQQLRGQGDAVFRGDARKAETSLVEVH